MCQSRYFADDFRMSLKLFLEKINTKEKSKQTFVFWLKVKSIQSITNILSIRSVILLFLLVFSFFHQSLLIYVCLGKKCCVSGTRKYLFIFVYLIESKMPSRVTFASVPNGNNNLERSYEDADTTSRARLKKENGFAEVSE